MDEPETMLCERCGSPATIVTIARMDGPIWPQSVSREGWKSAIIECPICGVVEQPVDPHGSALG
jgi:hypothetical protein